MKKFQLPSRKKTSSTFSINSKGMTLIEVMIAITIMAFVSISTYTLTTNSARIRDEIEEEGEFYNTIRAGFDQIERDISHIYSPPQPKIAEASAAGVNPWERPLFEDDWIDTDAIPTAHNSLIKPSNFWGLPLSNNLRVSRFQGSQDRISFIANSHIRLYEDALESDFVKVIYSLKIDKTDKREEGSTSMLEKTFFTSAFNNEEKEIDGIRLPVLFEIREFKFAFYDRVKDAWQPEWDSSSMETPNPFPYAIRIDASFESTNSKIGTFKIRKYFSPLMNLNEARRGALEQGKATNFFAK